MPTETQNETQKFYYNSPLSVLYLSVCDDQIQSLEYEPQHIDSFNLPLPGGDIKVWLDAYFAGQPLNDNPVMTLEGSEFQKKVWAIMLTIPYGETLSYGEVSKVLGSAPRAVGQACKRNPIPLIVPCHRIVAKHSVGGYEGVTEGHRLDRKKWLIKHEQSK